MPYADPDKQREAKRRYEQEKRKQRRTNWMLVFYEDQCPEWRDELDELGMRTLVSPSHDADEWTARDEKKNPKHKAGTLKEPHRHLLAMYDNPVSYDQVVKDFAFLKSKNVKYVKSLPAMARYLTHMDSPDKAQYDPEGVCEFGGADWRDLCATTSDKHLHEELPRGAGGHAGGSRRAASEARGRWLPYGLPDGSHTVVKVKKTYRLEQETIDELEKLCSDSGKSATEVIEGAIHDAIRLPDTERAGEGWAQTVAALTDQLAVKDDQIASLGRALEAAQETAKAAQALHAANVQERALESSEQKERRRWRWPWDRQDG